MTSKEAKDYLISLIERDTPMKVLDMGIDNLGIIRRFICPVCHEWLSFTDEQNFCPNCGKRLDWSKDDE